MSINLLFPSYVYHDKLISRPGATTKNLNKDLLDECYKFQQIDESGAIWSDKNYPGGYTSYGSISNLFELSTTFDLLKKNLDKHASKFVKILEMDIDPRELKLTSLWINIMPSAVVHTMHLHPLSVLSGTYYVRTPKNSSALKFEDPRLTCFMASPPRKEKAKTENQRFVSIQPKVGEVIMFESWMRHEVPPNQSEQDRVSISFNYDWV